MIYIPTAPGTRVMSELDEGWTDKAPHGTFVGWTDDGNAAVVWDTNVLDVEEVNPAHLVKLVPVWR